MILRDLATTWIKTNCPRGAVQQEFLKRLDDALQRSVGCSFVIGHKLTRSAKSYLVYCYCGELFAFQLTPRQTARLNVKDGMLVASSGLQLQNHEPHPEPLVQLKNAELGAAKRLAHDSRLECSLSFSSGQLWAMPMAIQVVCEPPGRVNLTHTHVLDHLPQGEGIIKFPLPSLDGLRDGQGRPFVGVMPLFLQIGIVGEPEKNSMFAKFGKPQLPAFPPPFAMLSQQQPGPPVPQKLGEYYLPPTPVPTLMTPDTMNFPPRADAESLKPLAPQAQRFRAVSDIRAVLLELE